MLGYDTMKDGLHTYFDKFKWKNTTLPDFVGCLHEAYERSTHKTMGDDFNFKEWCDSWLATSGINILEPVVEYNADKSIKSLQIKQTCDVRGKNKLRKQRLNVALYDSEMKPQVVENIILSDKSEINSVTVDFKGPVKAVVINHGDHAYAKVRFDPETLQSLG